MAEEFEIAAFRINDYISLNISRNWFLDMPACLKTNWSVELLISL